MFLTRGRQGVPALAAVVPGTRSVLAGRRSLHARGDGLGYDVEFIQIPARTGRTFPLAADQEPGLLAQATPLSDTTAVREALLRIPGCRPGPGDAVDYVGRGLNYARFVVHPDRIHVENNCSASELLKVHDALARTWPDLCILDVQSRQVHDARSFADWWAKPL